MIIRRYAIILIVLIVGPSIVFASKLAPQKINSLFEKSNIVLIGKVTGVTLIKDRGLNGREYEYDVQVITTIKGIASQENIVIRAHIGGVKGFDLLLTKNQNGVFFLHSLKNGQGRLTHWGSVAIFEGKYFK